GKKKIHRPNFFLSPGNKKKPTNQVNKKTPQKTQNNPNQKKTKNFPQYFPKNQNTYPYTEKKTGCNLKRKKRRHITTER
ncbi:hypothetical protein ACP0GZ_28230, partial [Escherichia coli]|uniref:hypothetical protein n=1 Tax=Escherichia coli TaxID=562 RepID=UPI003CEB1456